MVEGWAGKAKGLLQVLWETGWVDSSQLSKYIKQGKKGRDFNEDGSLKDEVKPFVLRHLMSTRQDFLQEESDLQTLARELSSSTLHCRVIFSTKYHCEIAGEGVEYDWGFPKKITRRAPMESRRDFAGFLHVLKEALLAVSQERTRKFRRRARKYMLAYDQLRSEQEDTSNITASYDAIEAKVKFLFVPTDVDTRRNKRKSPKVASKKRIKPAPEEEIDLIDAYIADGEKAIEKAQVIRRHNAAAAAADDDDDDSSVDIAAMQRTQLSHRGSHQDDGYLTAQVAAYDRGH